MLVSKNAKIYATPNLSRWNIGGVGSSTQGAGVGHVDFMLFVSFYVVGYPTVSSGMQALDLQLISS